MTIRTVGQLDRYLCRSVAWRKKELTTLKFAIDTAPDLESRVLLRAASTLLYAHWEGFVKDAGSAYLELVSRQSLLRSDLTSNFVAISLRSMLLQCGQAKKTSVHTRVVETLRTGLAERAGVPWRGVVKTRSNLTSTILEEIIQTLDLDFAPFQLKAKPIINRLVDVRNGIAHGEGVPIDASDYGMLHSEIVGLLEEFKTQIQDAAASKKYRI